MHNAIKGSIEVLDGLIRFIDAIDDEHYRKSPKPLFDSSLGQHLRHILDIYQALMRPSASVSVDYDVRRRNIPLERERNLGLIELQQVRHWLSNLNCDDFSQPIRMNTEVCMLEQHSVEFVSSYGRELCFASSHVTHHLALMIAIAKCLGLSVPEDAGIAPATASYLRNQEKVACVR